MNVIDIAIIIILLMSTVYGFYQGFLQTVASAGSVLVSVFFGFTFGPRLAAVVSGQTGFTEALAGYTDALVRVGDSTLASAKVSEISQSTIGSVLSSVKLPAPLADLLQKNLSGKVFQNLGLDTVNDYVSNTIVAAAVQVLCFLACVIVCYAVLSLIISLIAHIFRFPILKQLDWLAGGLFGILRGGVFVYLILLLIPIIATVLPVENFSQWVEGSSLVPHFQSDGLFVRVLTGR